MRVFDLRRLLSVVPDRSEMEVSDALAINLEMKKRRRTRCYYIAIKERTGGFILHCARAKNRVLLIEDGEEWTCTLYTMY